VTAFAGPNWELSVVPSAARQALFSTPRETG
jgi:hypothetical protein